MKSKSFGLNHFFNNNYVVFKKIVVLNSRRNGSRIPPIVVSDATHSCDVSDTITRGYESVVSGGYDSVVSVVD